MSFLRSLSLAFLVLAVMASSVTMAPARHQPRAVGEMVLCTGSGMVMVQIDAQGQPTGPLLTCADCLMAFSALDPGVTALPLPALHLMALAHDLRAQPAPEGAGPLLPRSRAPPVLV